MQYYSTNRQVENTNFQEAIFTGLPADNGLYLPVEVPQLSGDFFEKLSTWTLPEIGLAVAKEFIGDEIPLNDLQQIISEVLNFEIPLVAVEEDIYSLELYHGPTFAFKDVGARFLARCLSYFVKKSGEKLTILVATSGDTGSAVANGFYNVEGINVILLYPGGGKVSKIQEQQLTTLGGNITALEIDGTFDDCQRMVKEAFLDKELRELKNLTSANSINIARLIPQSFYYFHAVGQLQSMGNKKPIVFSVPSGNYGNLSAGLLAKKMGLPIDQIIATSNINKIVPEYLASGVFTPRPSEMTISNAMDVGNPSNFVRMKEWYQGSLDKIKQDVTGDWYNDKETKEILIKVKDENAYLMDPHGAVGYLGLKNYLKNRDVTGVFLETAHPAKFIDVVEEAINEKITIPSALQACLSKPKKAIKMKPAYEELRKFLLR